MLPPRMSRTVPDPVDHLQQPIVKILALVDWSDDVRLQQAPILKGSGYLVEICQPE